MATTSSEVIVSESLESESVSGGDDDDDDNDSDRGKKSKVDPVLIERVARAVEKVIVKIATTTEKRVDRGGSSKKKAKKFELNASKTSADVLSTKRTAQ